MYSRTDAGSGNWASLNLVSRNEGETFDILLKQSLDNNTLSLCSQGQKIEQIFKYQVAEYLLDQIMQHCSHRQIGRIQLAGGCLGKGFDYSGAYFDFQDSKCQWIINFRWRGTRGNFFNFINQNLYKTHEECTAQADIVEQFLLPLENIHHYISSQPDASIIDQWLLMKVNELRAKLVQSYPDDSICRINSSQYANVQEILPALSAYSS